MHTLISSCNTRPVVSFVALTLCIAVLSGCAPYLRDDYIGKDWFQGRDKPPDYSRDQQGSATGVPDDLPETSQPVPRDMYGNPILD